MPEIMEEKYLNVMLPDDVVDRFISSKLDISDWKRQLKESKVKFLTTLTRKFRLNVCYENITWGALAEKDRVDPSIEETIRMVTTTGGSACLQLNYFMQILLQHLGYTVYALGADMLSMPNLPASHMALMVIIKQKEFDQNILSDHTTTIKDNVEEKFLLNVGTPSPFHEPIPIKALPWTIPICKDFYMEYSYNQEMNVFNRTFIGGHPVKVIEESLETRFTDTEIPLKPLSFQDFVNGSMGTIFTDPTKSYFLNIGIIFRFLTLESATDFSYVLCAGRTLLVMHCQEERQITRYESYMDMYEDLAHYFPSMDQEALKQALRNYDTRRCLGLDF